MNIDRTDVPKYTCKTKGPRNVASDRILDKVESFKDEGDVGAKDDDKEGIKDDGIKHKKTRKERYHGMTETYELQRKIVICILSMIILMFVICPFIIAFMKRSNSKMDSTSNDVIKVPLNDQLNDQLNDTFNDIDIEPINKTMNLTGGSVNMNGPAIELTTPMNGISSTPLTTPSITSLTAPLNNISSPIPANISSTVPVYSKPSTILASTPTIQQNPSATPVIPPSTNPSLNKIITKINNLNDTHDESSTIKIPTKIEEFF